jgi:hypothetical protein
MYTFYTAQKDATIYLLQPDQNTGRDEILEINKTYVLGQKDVSRALIQFDITEISSSLFNGDITASSVDMLLKECESSEVPIDYTVYAYPVDQYWGMGIGTKFDDISTENVTWNSKETDVYWRPEGSGSLSYGGGTWASNYSSSQQIEYQTQDLSFDVSAILDGWMDGSIENHGLILKLTGSLEDNETVYGSLKYFSKETNTIYQPKIRIGWDDSTFITGSLPELMADDIKVTFKRLKSHYKVDSQPIIRVFGREKYPMKTYTNEYAYNDVTYLPSTTYYQVRDAQTHEIIIPFGEYSKVSCNADGNFLKLNLKNWETNRSYYIEIKTDRDGVVEFFTDDNLTFTVEK